MGRKVEEAVRKGRDGAEIRRDGRRRIERGPLVKSWMCHYTN